MPALESELDQLRARLARLENSTRPRGRCNMVRAAAYIGVSEETLRNMHKRDEGPPRKRIGKRHWSYAYDDLDAWLAARAEGKAT
jgi:predicted DNA-binding transcriptional regulator AlpA